MYFKNQFALFMYNKYLFLIKLDVYKIYHIFYKKDIKYLYKNLRIVIYKLEAKVFYTSAFMTDFSRSHLKFFRQRTGLCPNQ